VFLFLSGVETEGEDLGIVFLSGVETEKNGVGVEFLSGVETEKEASLLNFHEIELEGVRPF